MFTKAVIDDLIINNSIAIKDSCAGRSTGRPADTLRSVEPGVTGDMPVTINTVFTAWAAAF